MDTTFDPKLNKADALDALEKMEQRQWKRIKRSATGRRFSIDKNWCQKQPWTRRLHKKNLVKRGTKQRRWSISGSRETDKLSEPQKSPLRRNRRAARMTAPASPSPFDPSRNRPMSDSEMDTPTFNRRKLRTVGENEV